MTITLKSLTSAELTLNDYASIAADALAAINAINTAWNQSVKRSGYAANFRDCPQIHDELHLALLTEIVQFDDEPVGTLAEINFQEEMQEERERELLPRASLLSDEEWDYRVAQGIRP